MAAATQRIAGSAAFTAAIKSAVNVAIPQRRGTDEATNAIRTAAFSRTGALSVGTAMPRGRRMAPVLTRSVQHDACPRLTLLRHRESGVSPCGEATAQVGDVSSGGLKDA